MALETSGPRRALVDVVNGKIIKVEPGLFAAEGIESEAEWGEWVAAECQVCLAELRVNEATLVETISGSVLAVRKLSEDGSRWAVGNMWALLERAKEGDRMFDVSLDLVCVASLDGFFSRLSLSFEDVLGWSEEELYSRPFLDFVHPDDVDATLSAMDGLADGDSIIGFENRYQTRDGRWLWFSWTSRYDSQSGKIYALARDITDGRALRIALAEARDEAETASKAKSQFLASMSHELRTPLNAIIGYSEMLSEDAESDGEEQRLADLSKIQEAGRQLLGLINDVLDLSKIEAGTVELFYEQCDLAELLTTAAQTVHPLVSANNNVLKTELPSEICAETDQVKLRQIVLNLLANAAKFTTGGTITMTLEDTGANAVIIIEDTGIGMSRDDVNRVFLPFQQGRTSLVGRSHGGTGLGLSIAARFIDLLEGTMEVTSTEGVGTRFELTVPVQRPQRGSEQIVTGGTLVVVGPRPDTPLAR
jgi:PAS domain S-box-containing protein